MERLIKSGYDSVRGRVTKNYYTKTFSLFVLLPTLIAAFYYLFIASDIYVSQSKFSVNVEAQNMGGNPLGAILPSFGISANNLEAGLVEEYISSYTLLEKLDKEHNIREIFSNPKGDILATLPKDASAETLYNYFINSVKAEYNNTSGVTLLKVAAFTPEEARGLNQKILDLSEDFVNKMSDRVQKDALKFAEEQLHESEQLIIENNRNLSEFRNENKDFDPIISATTVVGITGKLEEELAKTNTKIANLKNYAKENNPRLESLKLQARAIESQIVKQSGKLAGDKTPLLATLAQKYEALLMQKEFVTRRYEITLKSYELEKVNAGKKKKYLLRIEEPTLLDKASEPDRLYKIFTVFICSLIAYTFGGLIIAGIKDHIRP
jgi:capsular polysaccharide transport system permease protein